jgi:hypothetical protein
MAVPFCSPQYLCDRKTVPPPLGNLAMFKDAVVRYKVDYFMFTEFWGGDRVPRFTFMRPMLMGKYISFYAIDRKHPDFVNLHRRYTYMKDFNLFGYFWKGRYVFQNDPPVFKALYHLSGNLFAGGALFVLTFFLALWLASRCSRAVFWLGCPILVVGLLFCNLISLKPTNEIVALTPPPVCEYQLQHLLQKSGAGEKDIRILENQFSKIVESFFRKRKFSVAMISSSALPKSGSLEPGIYFVPVSEKKYYISDGEQARRVYGWTFEMNQAYKKAENQLQKSGCRPEPIAGGVLCVSGH